MMQVEALGVSKTISGREILRDLSFTLPGGEVTALIGPNGSGKTTLLRLIGLLSRPDRGRLLYEGRDPAGLDRQAQLELRRSMVTVFQNPLFFRGSLHQNLLYGLKLRGLRPDAARLEEILELLDLPGREKQAARSLSGGEKQRLQLARALLIEPRLYLLDEPAANLDPLSRKRVENVIAGLAAAGSTVVFTTHNLFQARRLGRNFIFLSRGRINRSGPIEELTCGPTSLELAEFSGNENVFSGEIYQSGDDFLFRSGGLDLVLAGGHEPGPATILVRPEDVLLSREKLVSSARNSLPARVKAVEELGKLDVLHLQCGELELISHVTPASRRVLDLRPGTEVYASFKSSALHLL